MKKFMFGLMLVAAAVCSAAVFDVGYSPDAFANGTRCVAAMVVSTNATQTATVKAVYEFPEYGVVEKIQNITHELRQTWIDNYTYQTNWCATNTEHYVVIGGVTNYYTDVSTWTNKVPVWGEVPVTNWYSKLERIGCKAVTNDLYSLTASGGVGTNTATKLIGRGAGILVTGAPVELICE